jgi:hypothetical protein
VTRRDIPVKKLSIVRKNKNADRMPALPKKKAALGGGLFKSDNDVLCSLSRCDLTESVQLVVHPKANSAEYRTLYPYARESDGIHLRGMTRTP